MKGDAVNNDTSHLYPACVEISRRCGRGMRSLVVNVRGGGDDPNGATLNAVNASGSRAISNDTSISRMMKI